VSDFTQAFLLLRKFANTAVWRVRRWDVCGAVARRATL